MRKTCRFLCFVLALVFLFPLGLLPVSAGGATYDVTLTLGKIYDGGSGSAQFIGNFSQEISWIEAVGGSLPAEYYITHGDTDLWIEGTPSSIGSWTITIRIHYASGELEDVDVNVYVFAPPPDPPHINGINGGGTFEVGTSTTVSADVLITNSDTMNIVWYAADSPSYPMIHAVTSGVFTYTPPQTVGTVYYCYGCCGVNSDGSESVYVYSPFVAVTYNEPATPPPTTPVTTPPTTAPVSASPSSGPVIPKFNDVTGGGTYQMSETCTLTCDASFSGTIGYTWYGSDERTYESMVMVQDGTSSTYTPPRTAGTRYYCVAIYDNSLSDPTPSMTTSDFIEVTYVDPSAMPSGGKISGAQFPSPSPTNGRETGNGTNRGQGSETDGADPSADPSGANTGRYAHPGLSLPNNQNHAVPPWVILVSVGAVLVIAAIVVVIVLLARKNRDQDQ